PTCLLPEILPIAIPHRYLKPAFASAFVQQDPLRYSHAAYWHRSLCDTSPHRHLPAEPGQSRPTLTTCRCAQQPRLPSHWQSIPSSAQTLVHHTRSRPPAVVSFYRWSYCRRSEKPHFQSPHASAVVPQGLPQC